MSKLPNFLWWRSDHLHSSLGISRFYSVRWVVPPGWAASVKILGTLFVSTWRFPEIAVPQWLDGLQWNIGLEMEWFGGIPILGKWHMNIWCNPRPKHSCMYIRRRIMSSCSIAQSHAKSRVIGCRCVRTIANTATLKDATGNFANPKVNNVGITMP